MATLYTRSCEIEHRTTVVIIVVIIRDNLQNHSLYRFCGLVVNWITTKHVSTVRVHFKMLYSTTGVDITTIYLLQRRAFCRVVVNTYMFQLRCTTWLLICTYYKVVYLYYARRHLGEWVEKHAGNRKQTENLWCNWYSQMTVMYIII